MASDLKSKNYNGFTLIETLIYLALFGIIMGGVAAAAYGIVEAGGRSQTRVSLQEEGDFLLAKINWSLTGASSMSIQASPPSLMVSKYNFTSNPLVFNFAGTALSLKEGSGVAQNLNSDNAAISSLIFQDIPSSGAKPEGIKTTFTLQAKTPNGQIVTQDFEHTQYLPN